MLSKALQINTTLRSVTWDRNNTTATGFMDVARALEHNFTLQYMPLPLSDVTQAYRNAPEKTEQAITKIQRALLRNNQTQRFSQRQALRLHQGLVTSTAEQVMERLCVRVQQQVCVLRGVGEAEELQAAKQVLKEARNSRALYPSLCELAHVLSVDGPVRQRLDSLAGELAKAADKELQVIVDSMVSLCRELCPLSSTAAERLSPPLSSVSERISIPRSAIRTALMERAAQDIHRALEEVKLSVVSYLTNSIVDQILQELYATHKVLTRQVTQVKQWDGTCEGGTGRRHRHRDSLDITDEELCTSIDTIAIKKRSSRTRRIRPVSTRLSLCDDSSSSPPASAPPFTTPLSRSASWEGLSALPTQGAPLHHVTRVRPRPPRRHRGGHAPDMHCTENGAVTPLDDGLPDFYTKRVFPDSQLSSLHKAHSLRRKKRRNMLAIFGFRKNRNSTLCNQEPDSAGGCCDEECRTVATAPTGTATENVYTLLQPPRLPGRAGSPGEGVDGTVDEQLVEEHVGMTELRPVQGVGGSKPPYSTARQVQYVDPGLNSPVGSNRSEPEPEHERAADKQLDRHILKQSDRQTDRELDRQLLKLERLTERPTERELDRHTLRQMDRKAERQWAEGRQVERQWPDDKPTERVWTDLRQTDRQVDKQWTDLRLIDRQSERQWAEGRQTDRQTPSPNTQAERQADIQMDRRTEWVHSDLQTEKRSHPDVQIDQRTEVWLHEERCRVGIALPPGRSLPYGPKPDPPPQSSKPNLAKLRQRHLPESSGTPMDGERDGIRLEKKEKEGGMERGREIDGHHPPIPAKPTFVTSPQDSTSEKKIPPALLPATTKPVLGLTDRSLTQGEETVKPQAPVKPQRNRKALSCDTGTDRDSPNNLEKPQNRKPPVKKPRLPQNRNKSLDYPECVNPAHGNSEPM
uniref:CARMIL C-terminal domain-containing protein n=1 Tax=Denticeps clupeoides TaxID=299321 RepID=A0AAY4D1T4_9TELE